MLLANSGPWQRADVPPINNGDTAGSTKWIYEYGCGMIWAGFPSFFALGLEHSHIPTFWLLL